jgi:hypothetical protein
VWLADARGKAVKIISFLLTYLPETYDYQVIFMQRDLGEAIASQNTMLARRAESSSTTESADARRARETDDGQLRGAYEDHLRSVSRFLSHRSCFSTLDLRYHEVVADPRLAAARIQQFLTLPLDVDRMASVADTALYRNRRKVEV